MIRFQCGNCNERLSVPEKFAGRKGKCPGCGQLNRVPTVAEVSRPAEIPFPKKSTAPASIAPREPFTWSVPTAPAPVQQEQPREVAEAPQSEKEVLSDPAQRYAMFTEITERPDRWTRGPLKLEEGEKAEHRGALFHRKLDEEEDDIELTREWKVDRRRKLPKPVKIALLAVTVLSIIGALWGIFYLLLALIIKVNE